MIADLTFYKENYGGDTKIPVSSFYLWEKRAEVMLFNITAGKTEGKNDDRIKMCICEMAECLYENSKTQGIESENIDGYSVCYQNGDIKDKMIKIAGTYLCGTDYLYRGVDNDS